MRDVWYPVVRANVKTVFGMLGPRTTPWQEVQAHEKAHQKAGDCVQDEAGTAPGSRGRRHVKGLTYSLS